VLAYFLGVSHGWIETIRIPLIEGRDLRADETFPGAAIVNEAFVKQCFGGQNPIGRWFEKETGDGVTRLRLQVVGVVRNARYRNMREPITPTAYVPFQSVDASGAPQSKSSGTFLVRTSTANPLALASILRREVARARPGFRVSNLRTQTELNRQHTVRERVLAMLAMFFSVVALLLAGVGLYGALDYSVQQRQREIGIRIAIGAPAAAIVRCISADVFAMVLAGGVAGLALGIVSARSIEALLYQVKPSDPAMLAVPALTIGSAALVAALPAVLRAVRIDPVTMLRAD
jgi:predicted lysophospholipase L1 biosynthesis ABC-type transport system permease subunit